MLTKKTGPQLIISVNNEKSLLVLLYFTLRQLIIIIIIHVNKEDVTLLGAPVLKGKAQDKAIQDKIDDLTRAVERLKHLQAHDALVILKNSLAIPKLLYLLRTSV